MLKITPLYSGEALVLKCQGRIVRGDETALLCAAARQASKTVTLDLHGVEAIDAAGVGALVSLQAAGIYLKLLSPSERVRTILRVTKLDSILEISESEDASHENASNSVSEGTEKCEAFAH